MHVDLGKQLVLKSQTDVMMWSTAAKKVLISELIIPWEEGIPAAHWELWTVSRLLNSTLDRKHPPSRRWIQGLCGQISNLTFPSGLEDWGEPTEGYERSGRGNWEATGCGCGGGTVFMAQHHSQGSCRGCWGQFPNWPLPTHWEMYGVGVETSMNGGPSWWPCSCLSVQQ